MARRVYAVEREGRIRRTSKSFQEEHAMKRREFLTSSATLVGAAAFGGLTISPSRAADHAGQGRNADLGPFRDDAESGHSPDRHSLDDPRAAERPRRDRHRRQELHRDPEPRQELRAESRRAHLHVPPSAGRQVPRRQDDDLGGRQIFLRPLPGQGNGRGQFRGVQRRRRRSRRPTTSLSSSR